MLFLLHLAVAFSSLTSHHAPKSQTALQLQEMCKAWRISRWVKRLTEVIIVGRKHAYPFLDANNFRIHVLMPVVSPPLPPPAFVEHQSSSCH